MYVILLGLPGAGKGTQAPRLREKTGLAHITSGDLFRENIGKGTELGKKAKAYVRPGAARAGRDHDRHDAGPDLTPGLPQKGFMLDGFPRTMRAGEGAGRGAGE